MQKKLLSGIFAFGLFLLLPSSASAAGSCLPDNLGLSEFNGCKPVFKQRL
ncbi:hypothetical protein MUG87_18230 [Ectobacillus sp. JY-23]|jgi:hypothetical protein|nr:hypothetical protein [Ectobacillus sp. JY-23]UOY92341.1 hypothetical protein MUG87_18230 [Ectobacillus sp. JY-23]